MKTHGRRSSELSSLFTGLEQIICRTLLCAASRSYIITEMNDCDFNHLLDSTII